MTNPTAQDLVQLREQLREEIREARGTLKDLRREIKTARELVPLLTDELLEAEVTKRVDALGRITEKAMADSVARVTKTFDDLADLLTGRQRHQRRRGKPSIPDLITRAAAAAAQEGPLPFTCPRCRRTSHHPEDAKNGYCGNCHAFTGHSQGNR